MQPEVINIDNQVSPELNLTKKVSSKILRKRIIGGVIAVVLVVGSALGGFYFTKNLNQASVPNAPASEPEAAKKTSIASWNGIGKECKQGCGENEFCEDGVCKKSGGNADDRNEQQKFYGVGESKPVIPAYNAATYVCTPENCPSPCFSCNSSKTSCISNRCPGVSSNGAVGGPTVTLSNKKPTKPDPKCDTLLDSDGKKCPDEDCHCTGGDACTSVECGKQNTASGPVDLRLSCANQGRSWCVNMTGKGMTCCAAGYTCDASGKGCSGKQASNNDTELVTTINPTITSTTTVTVPPTETITTTVTIPPTETITTTVTVPPTETITTTTTVTTTPTDEPTLEPTIVSCNEECTKDSDCNSWLVCDQESDRCRRPSCLSSSDCRCTTERTAAKTTRTPSREIQVAERLPDTGIFDLPETTIFGGGLLLAIIGLFFAL